MKSIVGWIQNNLKKFLNRGRKSLIDDASQSSINPESNDEVMIGEQAFSVSYLSEGFRLQYFSWKLHGYGLVRSMNAFA